MGTDRNQHRFEALVEKGIQIINPMVEAEIDGATRKKLEAKGHRLVQREPWGNATAIVVLEDGTRVGAADPRGDGAGDAQ